MILPTKGITPDRSILGVGGDILGLMREEPIGVSTLWERYTKHRKRHGYDASVTFDWFILALDFLFMVGAVERDDRGMLVRHYAS
ncbi:ABC-three component system middle component 6 [Senegalimassilia anaerobia]|uniref:ABC-three component system middle component 6 n=1 Tax=Senegalimassilia anaerobia TaxID=1473216 RepID=UPI0026EB7BF7|nr:ABC-three component system middle component 6 [Senegalimassilia anaerobia]